ncbi:hypothetical protein FPZ12_034585 [Amycolatopsis acidicola]|uniref:Uncharacterized protein n=1 Tax=Amycolatopsis acidicola TaxID=2596893 RepID=A0A5N0UTU7_9PSEU|nr:hypothetical protein [Amycolatopsis acidicola]KAA9153470.1 hypothetical protein FPZ12_034585 [Amycolatopsis acidicola]
MEQVHLDTWHRGRADLHGDLLERHPGDLATALDDWETALRPHIRYYQENAFQDRKIFVMDNAREIRLRRLMPKLAKSRLGSRVTRRMLKPETMERKSKDVVGEVLAALPLAARPGTAPAPRSRLVPP